MSDPIKDPAVHARLRAQILAPVSKAQRAGFRCRNPFDILDPNIAACPPLLLYRYDYSRFERPLWNGAALPSKLVSRVGALRVVVSKTWRQGKQVHVSFKIENTSRRGVRNVSIQLAGVGVNSSRTIHIRSMRGRRTSIGTLSTAMSPKCDRQCQLWNRNRPIHLAISYGKNVRRPRLKGQAPAGYADYYGWKFGWSASPLRFVYAADKTAQSIAKHILHQMRSRGASVATAAGRLLAAALAYRYLVASGIRYIKDPGTPVWYTSLHWEAHYQFPAETFYRGRGDCEDLAILYSAILYRVGVKTTIVREPSHVTNMVYIDKTSRHVRINGRLFPLVSKNGLKYLRVDPSELGTKRSKYIPFVRSIYRSKNRGYTLKHTTTNPPLRQPPVRVNDPRAGGKAYRPLPWLGKALVKR